MIYLSFQNFLLIEQKDKKEKEDTKYKNKRHRLQKAEKYYKHDEQYNRKKPNIYIRYHLVK